jgi:hypothetical protein
MTFLGAVNRLLRLATLLQWDDDDITSFSQTQFGGTISLARQAIQHVTNDLIADRFLFPEDAQSTITTAANTQKCTLASDFVRFKDKKPWFFQTDAGIPNSQFLSEYPGKEAALKKQVPRYATETGTPQWYYFTDDQEVGIYPVPSGALVYQYEYQKDVMPENESDSLPVQSEQMAYAYVDMSARIFSFLFTQQPIDGINADVIYLRAKASLMALNVKEPPSNRYGFRYGSGGPFTYG